MELRKETLHIAIPQIVQIKSILKDKELLSKNKKINEIVNIIAGMSEIYGAINLKNALEIMRDFYEDIDEEIFSRYVMLCLIHCRIANDLDKDKTEITSIRHLALDEECANDILKSRKKNKIYPKEEYIKYGDPNFLEKTKGYKKIMDQFETGILDSNEFKSMFEEAIFNYAIDYRLGNPHAEEMLNELLAPFEEMSLFATMTGIDVNKVRDGFKALKKELHKWK